MASNELVQPAAPAAPAVRSRFELLHVTAGETVYLVDMPHALMLELIDHQDMTLRRLREGQRYTLVPIPSGGYLANCLKAVAAAWAGLSQPLRSLHAQQARIDHLLETVGTLFADIEFILVDTADELQQLVWPRGRPDDWEPRKLSVPVIEESIRQLLHKEEA